MVNFQRTNETTKNKAIAYCRKTKSINVIDNPICAYNAFAKFARDEIIRKFFNNDITDKNEINRVIGLRWRKLNDMKKKK